MCGEDVRQAMAEQICREEAVLVDAPTPKEEICGRILRLMGDELEIAKHGQCLKAIGDELDFMYTLAHLLAMQQQYPQNAH